MTELETAQRAELLRRAQRDARTEGTTATAIPFLSFLRMARATPPRHGVTEPSLCLVLQGTTAARRPQARRRTQEISP